MAGIPIKLTLPSTTNQTLNERFGQIRPQFNSATNAAQQLRKRAVALLTRGNGRGRGGNPRGGNFNSFRGDNSAFPRGRGMGTLVFHRGGGGFARGGRMRSRGEASQRWRSGVRGRGRGRGRGSINFDPTLEALRGVRGGGVYKRGQSDAGSARGRRSRGRIFLVQYTNRRGNLVQSYAFRGANRGKFGANRFAQDDGQLWFPRGRGQRGYARGGQRGSVRGGQRGSVRGGQRGSARGRSRGADRGGHRGAASSKAMTREELDSQLDTYMSKTKYALDSELDNYMAQIDD